MLSCRVAVQGHVTVKFSREVRWRRCNCNGRELGLKMRRSTPTTHAQHMATAGSTRWELIRAAVICTRSPSLYKDEAACYASTSDCFDFTYRNAGQASVIIEVNNHLLAPVVGGRKAPSRPSGRTFVSSKIWGNLGEIENSCSIRARNRG